MQAASQGPTEEYLLAEFRYGFIALLGMIIVSVVLLSASYSYDSGNVDIQQIHANIFTALTQGLVLYFISGMICLSFMRIAIIRHEKILRGHTGSDSTRIWLFWLTISWVLLSALALGLEATSPGLIWQIMSSLWAAATTVIYLVLLGIAWLMQPLASLFGGKMSQVPTVNNQTKTTNIGKGNGTLNGTIQALPQWLLISLQILLFVAVTVAVVLLIRFILSRWRVKPDDESEAELRESLSLQEVLRHRREERNRRKHPLTVELEPLNPTSTRARYRTLLQGLASSGTTRLAAETPAEYEARLVKLLAKQSSSVILRGDALNDASLLADMTRAYAQERYGGQVAELTQEVDWGEWQARLVEEVNGDGRIQ
jgi:hypothetical protein